MEHFRNIASSFIVVLSSAMSFVETYTIYARALAATLAILVSLLTIIRWLKNGKQS